MAAVDSGCEMDTVQCPKCSAPMGERALTAADGTPLGFAGGGESGALISLVCPACGYAELRASEAEPSSQVEADGSFAATTSTAADPVFVTAGAESAPAEAYLDQIGSALKARGILGRAEPLKPGIGSLIAAAISAAIMAAEIVWLWYSSGPVMEAGGFVAKGGPYVIAHPAEDWIWLPTLGATLMSFAFITNFMVAQRLNRPSLLLVFWTALFGILSVPFFKYGFNAPGGGRSWTWILLGFMFALFALPTALLLLLPASWRGFRGAWGWANVLGVVAGVAGGMWVWSLVAT
jgi:hypothetical protein